MVKELIIQLIKELINGVQGPNYFSEEFVATKLLKGVHLSEQNQAVVGGAYPDHFFPASESSVGEVEYKPTYIKLEKNLQSLHLKSKLLFSIYNMFERVCCLIF